MSKEATEQPTEVAVLPALENPKHPGMHLVSKIALFSLFLFLLLFALVAIAGNRVILNFELDTTARFSEGQLWVTLDEQEAAVFEPGDEVNISYENGPSVTATISQIGLPEKGELTLLMAVDSGEFSVQKEMQDISLSVDQTLKAFILSKLSW